jgi:hypothetical protein
MKNTYNPPSPWMKIFIINPCLDDLCKEKKRRRGRGRGYAL